MWDFWSCMHTFCTNTFLSRTCTDTPLVHLPHPLSHTDRDSYGETSRGSTVTPWRSVPPNNILLYCTPQLYDKLALPDFTVFSCQREPEPVFSHQIVSNTERAHCAEQKASPVLSLSLLMYGTFFFSPPTNRNTEIWFNVFVHELLRSVSKKELLLEPTRDSEDKSHFHHSGMENSKLRINGVIFRVSATSKKKTLKDSCYPIKSRLICLL